MAVKIPDPLERFRPAGLHGFIFRYQKSPLLKVIPFNCPVVAIVAHRILLSGDLISEFVNLHSNDVERAGILKASARRGRPACPAADRSAPGWLSQAASSLPGSRRCSWYGPGRAIPGF